MSGRSFHQVAPELVAQGGARDTVSRHDEDRVLAGDCSDHVRMARLVDRVGERRRVAARRGDDDQVPARLEAQRPATQREDEISTPVAVLLFPAARRSADRSGRTDLTRPSSVTSRETVVWTTSVAGAAQCLGELGLRRDRLVSHEAQDRALALSAGLRHGSSTPARICSARSTSSSETTSGGVRRSTDSPAVPTTSPASRQAATTCAAGRSARNR